MMEGVPDYSASRQPQRRQRKYFFEVWKLHVVVLNKYFIHSRLIKYSNLKIGRPVFSTKAIKNTPSADIQINSLM